MTHYRPYRPGYGKMLYLNGTEDVSVSLFPQTEDELRESILDREMVRKSKLFGMDDAGEVFKEKKVSWMIRCALSRLRLKRESL